MKRLISLLATLALVLSLIPAAFAEDSYIAAPYDPSEVNPAVTYMELLQGVRNKNEMLAMKRFLSALGFATLPVTANISSRAVSIMEETALKSDLGVADALIFATGLDTGDTLLSGNAKHFKEVPLLDTVAFRA